MGKYVYFTSTEYRSGRLLMLQTVINVLVQLAMDHCGTAQFQWLFDEQSISAPADIPVKCSLTASQWLQVYDLKKNEFAMRCGLKVLAFRSFEPVCGAAGGSEYRQVQIHRVSTPMIDIIIIVVTLYPIHLC